MLLCNTGSFSYRIEVFLYVEYENARFRIKGRFENV